MGLEPTLATTYIQPWNSSIQWYLQRL